MAGESDQIRDAEWRRQRRKLQRAQRARRRKRLLALSGGLVVVIAVAIALLLSSGNSKGGTASRKTASTGSSKVAGSKRTRSKHRGGGHRRGSSTSRPESIFASVKRDAAASKLPTPGPDVSVPILMYHVINPAPADAPFPGLYVPKREFDEQMQALYEAGFYAVTLEQLWRHWHDKEPLPKGKPIVISFDNGYASQYENALPELEKLGWKGVENIQLTGLPPSQGGLTKGQVKGLIAAGWELDTQGFSHAELPSLDASELHYQVAVARKTVQRRYGVAVNWFCYPSGHYDATVITAVQKAGFKGSTTVIPGWASPADDPYRLPRLRVLGGTSGSSLIALVEGTKQEPAPPSSYE